MLHFHATQKLLNVSRIRPVLYVSQPMSGQLLQNWYVTLIGSGFPGKMLLLYVHQPSLLAVMVKGKTISSTIDQFRSRLRALLLREKFPSAFVDQELIFSEEYVIGKTNSKSMLAHINQMVSQVDAFNLRFQAYEQIALSRHEDIFMDWLYKSKGENVYTTCRDYWAEII